MPLKEEITFPAKTDIVPWSSIYDYIMETWEPGINLLYIRWTTHTCLVDFSHTAVYVKTMFIPPDNLTDNFFFLPLTSLNIEQNLTKVTCHFDR